MSLIRPEVMKAHRAHWFVYTGRGADRTKIPHTANMRGHWSGYDVTCSCGWQSATGGATRRSVTEALWNHRLDEEFRLPPREHSGNETARS